MLKPTLALVVTIAFSAAAQGNGFSISQVRSFPFPNQLVAAPLGSRIAYALNEQGKRNVWAAEGPAYHAKQLTSYSLDDGQELTSLSISPDGRYVVYVRGGEHDANWDGPPPNPMSLPVAPQVQIWSVPFDGGRPKLIADGDNPVVSPKGDVVAFAHDHAIWVAPVDGSAAAKRLFAANGIATDLRWSPDGSKLAFASTRGDHALIGIFSDSLTPIRWIAPSTSFDLSPRWSPDGSRIAFVRTPGLGGAPDSVLAMRPQPWAIWVADVRSGEARRIWKSPETLRGSLPGTDGRANLHYAAGGRIVFLSEMDGWPHLYSIAQSGGEPTLLTPGTYMAEHITLSPDGRSLAFAANAGSDSNDIDRRHIVIVPVDRAAPQVMTPGTGIEWTPAFTGDGNEIAFIGATAQRPPLPAVMSAQRGGSIIRIGADRIPADYPTAQLVTPRKVLFKSPDGLEIHGQLFDNPTSTALARDGKKPALVFVHGGPPRQMLLGWHYFDYYSNSYALNQYLASRGFIVLSVNYRLGIGYGRDFQHPAHAGPTGASEYLDVQGGAHFLRSLPNVDRLRLGIFGGSYGGFLTAMALSHNSDLFAAGVDTHGVHDWTAERAGALLQPTYEKAPDAKHALEVAWQSSPVSAVSKWRSPVLLIQGDDDRNVRFHQTVDLARRLAKQHVDVEELVIPDEVHGFLRNASWVTADSATAAYFERKFAPGSANVASEKRR